MVAAQTADAIGDAALDTFINKVAHAIAGCAVGAANAGNSGGCAAGAIGAVIGEMTAESIGRRDDTVAVASLMAGIAAALAGGDAAQVNLAASAGGNAAANNYLSHRQQDGMRQALQACAGDAVCIQRQTIVWRELERQQSEAAASCKTVAECTEISQTARTGNGFTLADAQTMCNGVPICVDFAVDLGRRNIYDEINARDTGYANALAARRAQLLASGMDPDSANIAAGITPGDAASAVGGIAGAALGGVRTSSAPSSTANAKFVARIDFSSLPASEQQAISRTINNLENGTIPNDSTGIRWGIPFQNRAGDLPGGQGSNSPYLEYRVAPPAGISGAGANRIVFNPSTGEIFYTWTHYGDGNKHPAFVQLR